jgi:integrase
MLLLSLVEGDNNMENKILDSYFQALQLGEKSPCTIRVYEKDLGKFVKFFNVSSQDQLTNLSVSDFQKFYQSQSNLSPNSLNGLIRSLSAYFYWMRETGYIEKSDFFKVKFGRGKFVKVPKTKKLILSEEEQLALIKGGNNLQDKFMIAVLLFTAIRRDEICKIKMSDINGCQILINGKGSKQRPVYLDETLCNMMNLYLAERAVDSEYLFYTTKGKGSPDMPLTGTAIYNRVKSAAKNAGIDPDKIAKLSVHTLRRTAITRLSLLFGRTAAARVAGHASEATTAIYDQSADEVAKRALLGQRALLQGA